jgi:hypothetical protein
MMSFKKITSLDDWERIKVEDIIILRADKKRSSSFLYISEGRKGSYKGFLQCCEPEADPNFPGISSYRIKRTDLIGVSSSGEFIIDYYKFQMPRIYEKDSKEYIRAIKLRQKGRLVTELII